MDKLHKLATEGDALAQFALGVMYLNGHGEAIPRAGVQGIEQSDSKARQWFLASAKQGCAWAMYNFAWLSESREERLTWLHKAANYGLSDAQVALIQHYCNLDKGAEIIDVVEAYKWALLAYNQGHPCVTGTNQLEILECRMNRFQMDDAKKRAALFTPLESNY